MESGGSIGASKLGVRGMSKLERCWGVSGEDYHTRATRTSNIE